MSGGKIMRYNLPKNDIVENLKMETEEYFASNNIDVKDLPNALYLDIFCAATINALDFFLDWRHLPEKEINKTLSWVSQYKRKEREQMNFYSYQESEIRMSLAVARLRVQVEKKIENSLYVDELMKKYDFYVLDDLDMEMKQRLTQYIGASSWDVFEVLHYRRGVELINYGDFRILTWEMTRSS